MGRSVRLIVAVLGAVAVGAFGFAAAAAAHVVVDPGEAPQGGEARVVFRVPNESDTASTTKVEVNLPTDQPVASVSVMRVNGWTASTTTTKLAKPITTDDGATVTEAVSKITWTAGSADAAIKPGEFLEFPVDLGPLPKSGSMTFKTLQTYSDGSVVRWIDESEAGQPEPDHPAPVLKLVAGSDDTDLTGPATRAAATNGSSNGAALPVAIVAAVLGLGGLILGGLAFVRGRRAA